MSGAIVSSFPSENILYGMATGATGLSLQHSQNQLMQDQQEISGHRIEMGARLATTLLDESLYPTTEARAAAYPGIIARARSQYPGYFENAPATYPGDESTRALARLGTPSADLYKLGIDRQAKGAIAPGDGGTTAGTGGGGTGTAGGADTAPINAAGDSRTRKAGEGGPPAAGSPGAAVAKQVHDFWIGKGYSEEQTAGIMAGGPGSESDFTPTAVGDKGTSIGLYQHHGPRADAMRQFFGLSPGQMPTADQQNQYAHWEITQGPLKNVGEMLKNAKTPAEAAAIWTQYFGVPADRSEIGRRAAGAHRFVGLYGQPQQGGPGGATATAAPPGVQMGGAAPPPPGGAPGAYPAYGGGMGAVIGQGVRPNVGGPQLTVAPPPAIGAQPIPAGRTASNADIMVGGIQQARATPLPGTQVAGPPMVASTQPTAPVAAEDLTPTPAQYAGTAPAPSAEAPPETGWGSQVGSGYGPQNALAPAPVPPAPARPTAPAPVATATQPPAADTLPPLPAPTPPERLNNNRLTGAQQHDIDTLRNTSISSEHLQARVDAYRTANDARAEKYQADQMAYLQELRLRQGAAETQRHAGVEEQRQAAELALRQEAAVAARRKADQEAVEANKPFHGNAPDAQNRNILIEGTNSGKTDTTEYQSAYADYGTEKVDANGLKYRPDMSPYATPTGKTYGKGEGGRELGKADIGSGSVAPTPATTAMLGISHSQRLVMRALENLNKYPGGVGIMKGSQPNIMSNWTDPEGVNLRADIGELKAYKYHDLSGAAVTAYEEPRLQRFTPQETDTAEALRTKLTRSLDVNRQTLLDHYRTYGPEAGFRRLPNVEEEILATIPQTALDHLKENPKTAKDFDKQFGRGAAKVALQNG